MGLPMSACDTCAWMTTPRTPARSSGRTAVGDVEPPTSTMGMATAEPTNARAAKQASAATMIIFRRSWVVLLFRSC
jgi:hypothetical protein